MLHVACLLPAAQVIFRNVHKLLVDTASSEFLFCLDFWEDESVFKELFGPVVAVVESDLATQLQVTEKIELCRVCGKVSTRMHCAACAGAYAVICWQTALCCACGVVCPAGAT
jgi:hypothetical protein